MARILIIDDEDQARNMLLQALEREGHEVVAARDGNEGLQLYHTTLADLIITDILMPEKEGLETIMELRREFPDVKIIAMSGGGHKGNLNFLQVAKRLGAQRTLQKPFHLQEVIQLVAEVLDEA